MDEKLDDAISEHFRAVPPPPTERAAQYLEMRKVGMALHSRLLDLDGQVHPLTAAKAMGIPSDGRTIIFDGEWEMSVLSEYSNYFHVSKGKRHIDRALDGRLELNAIEKRFLVAQKAAFASVFETVEVRPATWEVEMIDRLGDRGTVTICDRNWSQSASVGMMAYVRILPCGDFFCSSGVSLPLWAPGDEVKDRDLILRRCRGALHGSGKRSPAHALFYVCRQLHLRFGSEVDYR